MLFVAIGVLVFSGVLVAIFEEWRIVGPSLALYFVALAAIVGASVAIEAGLVRLVVGATVVAVLSPTWPNAHTPRLREGSRLRHLRSQDRPDGLLRLIVLTLALVGTYRLALQGSIVDSVALGFAIYWLGAAGATVLTFATGTRQAGIGIFLLLGAVELAQSGLGYMDEQLVLAATALVNVILALAIAYLIERCDESPEVGR